MLFKKYNKLDTIMMKKGFVLLVFILPLVAFGQKFKIPTPNQNVKDAFSLAASIYTGHSNNVNFQNRISSIANTQISVSDPHEMIAEYKRRLQQLEYEARQRAQQKEIELKKKIDLINKGVTQALKAADVNLGTWGNLAKNAIASGAKNVAVRNAQKKIAEAKAQAQSELDAQLKSAMDEVYNKVILENEQAQKEYLKAAANVFDENEEKRYIANFKFHACAVRSMKNNYNYKSTEWLETGCTEPPRTFLSYGASKPNVNYKQNVSNVDFSDAMNQGNMTPEQRIMEVEEKFQASMAKLEKLLANATDPAQKIDLMAMKQELIDKVKQEKSDIQSGTTQVEPIETAPARKNTNNYQPYLDAAKRKYHLYRTTMNYPEFLEASKMYAEAEISENRNNPEAYAFLGHISDDVVEKMAMSAFALYIDRGNTLYKKEFERARDKFGVELFAAIKAGNTEFIDKASSYNLLKGFSYQEKSPLMYAIEMDKKDMIDKLNAGAYNDDQILMLCIEYGGESTAKMYLDKKNLSAPVYLGDYDVFGLASKYKRDNITSYLLDKSYPFEQPLESIRYRDNSTYIASLHSIMFWSVEKGKVENFEFASTNVSEPAKVKNANDLTVIKQIIRHDRVSFYDVLKKNGYNLSGDQDSPAYLEFAIDQNAEKMGIKLIDEGVDVKVVPSSGGSLVNILAAKSGLNSLFDRLIKEGVDLSAKDNSAKLPIEIALRAGQEVKAKKLLEKNASIDFGYDGGGNQLHWIINNGIGSQFIPLIAQKVKIDYQDKMGDVPLMTALKKNKQGHIDALLAIGASPDVMNNSELNPLMYAVYKKDKYALKMASASKDPNVQGQYGWSMLHFAAKENQIEVAKILLAKGASPLLRDQWKQTPYRIAKDNGNNELAKLLRERMTFMDVVKSMPFTVKKAS
jgi:ankyrin repeat protein